MLQNARVNASTGFELLRENQQGGGKVPPLHPTQILYTRTQNSVKAFGRYNLPTLNHLTQ